MLPVASADTVLILCRNNLVYSGLLLIIKLKALRFQSCVSSSYRILSRSEEVSQGRSELFCGSRSSSEHSADP
jgi:hypothetical protein